MDSYKVIISPKALSQLEEYIAYIRYSLLNDQAAKAVWDDAVETAEKLETVAGSLKFCDDPDLKALGYRKLSFTRHRYIMLYRIENQTAYVDAVYHQLQDYENTFSDLISDEK